MAGTAFGAFLVPACMTMPPASGPDASPTPSTPVGYRPMPGPLTVAPRKPREQFAAGRDEPTTTLTARPTAVADTGKGLAQVGGPVAEEAPMPHPANPPLPAAEPMPGPVAPTADAFPLTAEPPRLPAPLLGAPIPVAEPPTDAEGVIRPPKPIIPGAPPVPAETPAIVEPPAPVPAPGPALPPVEAMPRAKAEDVPFALIPPSVGPPPVLPIPTASGPVIGSSVHEAKASPAVIVPMIELPPAPPTAPAPPAAPAQTDSPLLKAVRAFQASRPDEAVEHLRAYDPTTQQILLSLMPAMVRLTEGKLQQMKPEEMDALLDQFSKVTPLLRPRASLQGGNVRLCREVHTFGHVEAYADTHVFRPGDVVHLYLELANFTSVPDGKGGYTIELSSGLELRDGGAAVVWRADPKDVPDRVSTPPQDYYRAFRLAVPAVPPGTYTLAVKTTDRPSGREVRKAIELRIGSK